MSRITFGGLASGLETNLLIDELLQLEREPIRQMETKISNLEQVKGAWRDVNMRLRNLRDTVLALTDRDNLLSKQAVSTQPACVSAEAGSSAIPAVYELQVGRLATNHTVAMQADLQTLLGKSVDEALDLKGIFRLKDMAAGDGTFKEIRVEESDSLIGICDRINAAAAGVTASIIGGHLVLKSDFSGEANTLVMAYGPVEVQPEDEEPEDNDPGHDVLNILGIYNTDTGEYYKQTLAAGNAVLSINGIEFIHSSNTIDDLVEDVTFTLYDTKDSSAYVQISPHTEQAINLLGSFVEQYNSVNDFIRESSRYVPGATGKIELDKIKAGERGLLQGDTALMRIEQALRALISSPVSGSPGKYHSLADLGVTTLGKDGFLQLDAGKLEAALQDDSEGVFYVMQHVLLDEQGEPTDEYGGVAAGLDGYLKRLLESGLDSQGRTLTPVAVQQEDAVQRRIDELQRRIEIREERLLRYEERLIRQFTALEKYISAMQEQGQRIDNMAKQFTGFSNSNG